MKGEVNRLYKGAKGECLVGYLESRYIGNISLVGAKFAFELEEDTPFTSIDVISAGVLKYLNGPDWFESEMTSLEVNMALEHNRQKNTQALWALPCWHRNAEGKLVSRESFALSGDLTPTAVTAFTLHHEVGRN